MIRSRTSLVRTSVTALAVVAFAACTSGSAGSPASSEQGSIASASPDPTAAAVAITLRLATAEDKNLPSQPFLDRFVAEVAKASGGSMAVEVTYKAAGEVAMSEQQVADRVIAGDVDMAVVPVRAWSDVGVTSLQALQAPFLIDNDALLTAVTTDDALVQPLLDGMREQGLIGLAVWPEDLRHPFTFEANGVPIVSPEDFKGQKIWAVTSKSQQEVFETLGATMIDDSARDSALADGSLRGAESGLWSGALNLADKPTATADVTIYPKFQVMVVEDAVWSRLSPDQQAVVKAAAVAAREQAVVRHSSDADLAQKYCLAGGKVVLAGPANVAKFMDAAKPIYDRLEGDPLTATAIAGIRALKSSTPSSAPTKACLPPVSATATIPPIQPGLPIGMIPDGTYQLPPMSMDDLVAKGVDVNNARNNAGTWSMVIHGATDTWTLKHSSGQIETCAVSLTDVGDRIRIGPCAGAEFYSEVRWALVGDQLTLTIVYDSSNLLSEVVAGNGMFGGPWTKVE